MNYKYVVKEAGIRLDKYLSDNNNDLSRAMIQKLIEMGNVIVNSQVVKASYKVCVGDVVEVEVEEPKESKLKSEEIPLNIVYEDNDIIVINKEKGMVVHPGNGNLEGTLANAILAKCKDSLSGIGGEIRPGIVHRLDKDTSGLIIVAKNDKAHIKLSDDLKEHKIKKTYLALVRGIVKENEATIDMPIGRSDNVRTKMAIKKSGKNAVTHFKVLKRYGGVAGGSNIGANGENNSGTIGGRNGGFTLLEVQIETGRTHQIRVHMAEIGYPVVGDYIYSNGKNPFNVEGQMLHAWKLEFAHPITGEKMQLEAELPEYFNEVLNYLNS